SERGEPASTVPALTFTSRSDMMSLSNYFAAPAGVPACACSTRTGRTAHAGAREHPVGTARLGRPRRALQVDRAVEHDARDPDGDHQPVDPADLAAGAVPRHQAQPAGAVQHLLLPLGLPRLPAGHRGAG